MRQIEQIHQKKHCAIIWFFCTVIMIIFLRLLLLQVVQHERLAKIGERNFVRFKMIPAQRGNILDCKGSPLVTNTPITTVIWQGTGNQSLTEQQKQLLQNVGQILQKPFCEKQIKLVERLSRQMILAQHVAPEILSLLAEQCSDLPNIIFETAYERFYPYDRLACHILGYLSDVHASMEGKTGLEKLFEEQLKGEPGINQQYINSFGALLENKQIKDQSCGQDIVTTIDLSLQKIAEQCMGAQQAGIFLLINPKTGAIPALVSRPNFEPSVLSKKMTPEVWKELQENRPFVNRAFNATYPPASIFKLVTVAAALEEKIITEDSMFNCRGYAMFKDRKYHCNRHSGHGIVTLKEGLAYSCNIPCYKIAQRLPIDTLASYAFEFGLGNKTDVPFSEKSGLVPTNEWKKATKGERWWTGETLSACIGQSFLLVTPIQLACMIGSIFEGYLVKPRILMDQEIVKTPISISRKTREFLQDCMKSVIDTGTGRLVNRFLNITIFAKTGTAQTINLGAKNADDKGHLEHASFVSYFYTEKSDPLVLIVLLEHVGGARIAVGVAKDFFRQYIKHIKELEKAKAPL